MDELQEYHRELMADIRREADTSGILMVEAFFERMAERLAESGELEVAERAFYLTGDGAMKVRIDGYAGDPRDADGVLGLIVCDFSESDELETFRKSDVAPILNPLIRFLEKARDEDFRDSLNEINPAFQVSDLVISTWSLVRKVKLILISNRRYASRDDLVPLRAVDDIPVTWSVWDLTRFERFDRSGQAREDMVVDFAGEFGAPLPAIRASQDGAALESYLAIVPGPQLARVYDRWGARLLEANVRTFLQARAKTNRGIQKTIRDEPELFFPYNNGLSATAEEVRCVITRDGLAITSVNNLQIVNGAQTTGSIHAALRNTSDGLEHVYVQMKLTVVPPDRSEEIVPKISEFANTQNRVSAADFFSNHPFHVRMEEYSRRIIFAAPEGQRHDSKWFYERSRGQYRNDRSGLTDAQRRKFDLEYPKGQMFSKTDLAKFENSANGHPDLVSRGAQKNFAAFAREIGQEWAKDDSRFNELWFRRLIAKALIFRKLEKEVPGQSWYEGGYRANIVTYAMAKVFYDTDREREQLDLDAIWKRQDVPGVLTQALLIAAEAANKVITSPSSGIRNMSEWAKQQACWNRVQTMSLDYPDNFDSCLILKTQARSADREGVVNERITDGIKAQTKVVELGAAFWKKTVAWGEEHELLTTKDIQILKVCASIPRKLPSDLQARHAIQVLTRLEDEGYNSGE